MTTKQQITKWKKNRKAWVKALRSGKYKQGKGMLLTHQGRYCCLGVLCDIIGMKPLGTHYSYAPPKATKSVGLTDTDGVWKGCDGINSLADKNDQGMSFSKIADIIESEPEGLFLESQ